MDDAEFREELLNQLAMLTGLVHEIKATHERLLAKQSQALNLLHLSVNDQRKATKRLNKLLDEMIDDNSADWWKE